MPSHLKPLIATAIGCIALAVPSTTSAAGGPACGAVIVKSTTLRSDLKNCPGNGLVIGADNLTLDLGGHTIDGTGTLGTVGILIDGHHGVTVTRGKLKEFDVGVGLGHGADRNRLDHIVVTASVRDGIDVFESHDNVVSHVTSSGNGASGMIVVVADRNRFVDSTFADNPVAGILLAQESNGNRVTGNVVTGSGRGGHRIDLGDDNLIAGNRLDGNVNGISFYGNRTQIVDNLITHTIGCDDGCGAGIDGSGGSGNLIERNRVIGTRLEGIRLNEFQAVGGIPVTGNVVRNNLVHDAGTDGIALQTLHERRQRPRHARRQPRRGEPRDRLRPRRHQHRAGGQHRHPQPRAAQPRPRHRSGAGRHRRRRQPRLRQRRSAPVPAGEVSLTVLQ